MKKLLSIICILLGIVLVFYPTAKDRYESYQQQKLLKQWQENLLAIEEVVPEPIGNEVAEDLGNSPAPTTDTAPSTGIPTPKPTATGKTAVQKYMEKHVEGVLSIEKIKLKLPVLKNATQKNLALSLASIARTGKPGAVGNYAVAGHRDFTYGKNFNRLNELEIGDIVEVDTGKEQYKYEVSDKRYVLPTEVEVLKGNGKDSEITLVTCHPMKNPTHRLIIKGKLILKSA